MSLGGSCSENSYETNERFNPSCCDYEKKLAGATGHEPAASGISFNSLEKSYEKSKVKNEPLSGGLTY
jgi:hypothetical protein